MRRLIHSRDYLKTAETVYAPSGKSSSQQLPKLSRRNRQKLIQFCSSGWKFRYQRRLVKNEEVTMDLEVDIPQSQVRDMLDQCIASKTPDRFPFPIAFSHDLNQLIVLSSILSVRSKSISDMEKPVFNYKVQLLERTRGTISGADCSGRTAYSIFSPTSEALALVSRPTTSKNRIQEDRKIQVWSDVAADGDWPNYNFRGETTSIRTKSMFDEDASPDLFAFHSTDQVLFYIKWNTTNAWRFDEHGKYGNRQ
jgi:hypothetical protein